MLANLMLLYVPIMGIGLGFLLLVVVMCLLLEHKNLWAMVFALTMLTIILELSTRWVIPNTMTPYYRPHELLALEKTYRPNQKVRMDVPHGDLPATDPTLPMSLAQPREEVFITDSLGYRNDEDYKGQKLLIVGDSYVVGIGNTQDDTLTSQLHRHFGVHAYNVGFPSGPLGYAEKVKWARTHFPRDSCVVVVFFEGNDFKMVNQAELASRTIVPKSLQQAIKVYVTTVRGHSEFAKAFYGLTTRAWEILHKWFKKPASADLERNFSENITFVKTIRGMPMAFLRGYAEVVLRPAFDDHGFIKDQLSDAIPDLLVFVPDKYRVYGRFFDEEPVESLPNAQWDYLLSVSSALGVPAINLTDPMQERARGLLSQGQTVYWRDDTHWNREGIAVGAGYLVRTLGSIGNSNCRATVVSSPPSSRS
ncbi:MAG: hypothetical protein NNA31_04550 [Nitrospira sp.]|nr:hypothetical protein [Nitrospira sp.]